MHPRLKRERRGSISEWRWESIDLFNVGERVMVLGDMNAKMGDVRIEGITGSFRVLEWMEMGKA